MQFYIIMLIVALVNLSQVLSLKEYLVFDSSLNNYDVAILYAILLILFPLSEIICLAKEKLKNNKEQKMKDWKGDGNSIYKTIGASNHTKEDRAENDYYATDPIAIDKLLKVEQPSKYIWECACGEGHLADRLKAYGYTIFATDIVNRGGIASHMKKTF